MDGVTTPLARTPYCTVEGVSVRCQGDVVERLDVLSSWAATESLVSIRGEHGLSERVKVQ